MTLVFHDPSIPENPRSVLFPVRFCGRLFSSQELELMQETARDYAGLGGHGDCAHRVRVVGLETSERKTEGPGMPTTAGALARSGLADSTAGAELGAARATPHSTEPSVPTSLGQF